MTTHSARPAGGRPFCAAYGRAFGLLITHPVQPWADTVSAALDSAALDSAGIVAPARVLGAGCGTGRHAAELARRGYRLDLADASASLLARARALPHAPAHHAETRPATR
jgi:SAM-dependent methyltransferase